MGLEAMHMFSAAAHAGKKLTLSISENSIRSSCVQFRPMGEMLSMPFLNSMKVPLQMNATKDWVNYF